MHSCALAAAGREGGRQEPELPAALEETARGATGLRVGGGLARLAAVGPVQAALERAVGRLHEERVRTKAELRAPDHAAACANANRGRRGKWKARVLQAQRRS